MLALDVFHSHTDASRLNGEDVAGGLSDAPVHTRIGSTNAFGYAPAVECSFTSQFGMLLGVRFIVGGHNVSRSMTPAVAINCMY